MSTTTAPDPNARQAAVSRPSPCRHPSFLGCYTDTCGKLREVVWRPGAHGSRLVIDRLADTLCDRRLVAHLDAGEPVENAQIICEIYLADETRGRCRPVSSQDLELAPFAASPLSTAGTSSPDTPLSDADGNLYRIRVLATDGLARFELRWTRSRHSGREEPFDPVTLREVIARLEDYEPTCAITSDALAAHRDEHPLSTHVLRDELERLGASSIVLNRGLREVVQRKVACGELNMSEIAMRCGRVKRDRRGNVSGETSWLARRIGQLPEGGEDEPTPWVRSDVLALIVREGLGAAPYEVEL